LIEEVVDFVDELKAGFFLLFGSIVAILQVLFLLFEKCYALVVGLVELANQFAKLLGAWTLFIVLYHDLLSQIDKCASLFVGMDRLLQPFQGSVDSQDNGSRSIQERLLCHDID
jgi:hypothetical protein